MASKKRFLLVALFVSVLVRCASGAPPVDSEEFIGPFPNWADLKRDFGAVGDGKADDTVALQKALDSLSKEPPANPSTLFIPAGTYRITKGLTMTSQMNVSVLGADPATTIIKWDGPDEGSMLFCNGVRYSRWGRLTWDGGGKKVTAIFHEWDGHTPNAGTGNEHADQVFRNVAFGIRAGKPHFMDAETEVVRCKFQHVSEAGVRIQSFNALDWFIWDCEFDDCAVGVTNDPGAGHFHVYRSIFRNSTVADITLRNAGYFSFRHNVSIGSNQFLDARDIGGWAVLMTVQNNTILDTKQPISIQVSNLGPTLLIDNTIRSRSDVKEGPVVRMSVGLEADYVAVGNTFTVPKPISARDRFLEIETKVVTPDKIVEVTLPGAATPQAKSRSVIEVPVGADGNAVQAAINKAAEMRGQRPIVHFLATQYNIDKTLTIPAGADVQLVGESFQTRLKWSGAEGGTILNMPGPSRATCRDLTISGNAKVTGLAITDCDRPGSRIFGDQLGVHGSNLGLLVDSLDETDISLNTFYHSGNKETSIKVLGGPNTAAGKNTPARTVIFGGASSNSAYNYDVHKGGRLMVQDMWYEGSPVPFMKLAGDGTFTLSGARIAPGRPGANAAPSDPSFAGVALENFRGRATFLSANFGTRVVVAGRADATNLLLMGMQSDVAEYLAPVPSAAHVAVINSRRFASQSEGEPPTRPVANIGSPDPKWVLQMLEQVRTMTPRVLSSVPAEATDLRFYRVNVEGCGTAIHVQPKAP